MEHQELDTQNPEGVVFSSQFQERAELENEIRKCNEMCTECMDDFQREGFAFSADYCRYCQNGAKLHRLLIRQSEAEAKWGNLDWNSCKLEKFYNG